MIRRLESLDRHVRALRMTTSLLRSLANLGLVVTLIYVLDSAGSLWRTVAAVALAGAIIAIFGVAIPHAWATHAGERVLAATLPVLMFFRYALYPVTAVMAAFDLPIRRLVGVDDQDAQDSENAKQEILQVASWGRAEGAVNAEEVQMIESVIEFGDTRAAEIMTPRTDVFALPADAPWAWAIDKVIQAGHTRVPVYEGDLDHIIGVLHAKDMLRYVGAEAPADLRSVLRKCYFVPETKPLDELLKEFKARKVHLAVVLDEYGGTAGIVSIEDVVEEIVGDIADEYDQAAVSAMKRIDRHTVEIDGRCRMNELNDALDLRLPQDADYDTVAGFILSELGYVPPVGETLESHGVKLTVLAADERKITKLRAEAPKSKQAHKE
jgi:magnesium and cobalt transporter